MTYPIFARKGGAAPSLTEDQAERAIGFSKRRIISLSGFSRQADPPDRGMESAYDGFAAVRSESRVEPKKAAARPNRRRKFSLRLDADLHGRFRRAAAVKGVSGQKYLEGLLRDHLDGVEGPGKEAEDG